MTPPPCPYRGRRAVGGPVAHAVGSRWRGRSQRRVGSRRPIKFLGRVSPPPPASFVPTSVTKTSGRRLTKGFAETGPVWAARPSLYTASNLVVRCGQIRVDLSVACLGQFRKRLMNAEFAGALPLMTCEDPLAAAR
ncbi:hypothetical protein MTO96_001376 [Rhipicephalus appendiculatus]